MNRETIENEGRNIALSDLTLVGLNERTIALKYFAKGAEWRINSVWHDMKKEVPQVYGEYENEIAPSIPCLVKGYLSTGYGYGVRYWNVEYGVWDDEEADDFECEKDKIECWAYLDDLIPDRKEETK